MFKEKGKPLYPPFLSSGSYPSGQRNRIMMLASVLGSGPRAGLCSGPSWGPHSCSGPAPPHLHHEELTQGHCKAVISFCNQSAINMAAEEPPVTSHRPWCSILASHLLSTINLGTEPYLTVVFIPSA